ncbi:helix-turn-helix transcriptional regulator [Streptomyces sp. PTM05]|uniref:Helix-turn-helix transcriptional regulator n=1 Tax=Streptantibioticus parmotrematis TaxID=2873249 RepID=A0ABS7QXL9_9ACTN|nr:helix-turn-helix domain-containing protein [Streptantibioticus parmotrematis]MBY8887961.1 helix-turn-helix transcriptional regulator [Streptantibioticus parmotrematis]
MALPRDYTGQACSLARALEVVGERWTLLVVRDAFFGVRRFGDFADHLGIPRAVLTDRLASLTAQDVLARVPGAGRRSEYELTAKGVSLWPVVRGLMAWGDDHYGEKGPRRVFLHAPDGGAVGPGGHCEGCGADVSPADVVVAPGPGLPPASPDDDPVTAALAAPHRLLTPLRAG